MRSALFFYSLYFIYYDIDIVQIEMCANEFQIQKLILAPDVRY